MPSGIVPHGRGLAPAAAVPPGLRCPWQASERSRPGCFFGREGSVSSGAGDSVGHRGGTGSECGAERWAAVPRGAAATRRTSPPGIHPGPLVTRGTWESGRGLLRPTPPLPVHACAWQPARLCPLSPGDSGRGHTRGHRGDRPRAQKCHCRPQNRLKKEDGWDGGGSHVCSKTG